MIENRLTILLFVRKVCHFGDFLDATKNERKWQFKLKYFDEVQTGRFIVAIKMNEYVKCF